MSKTKEPWKYFKVISLDTWLFSVRPDRLFKRKLFAKWYAKLINLYCKKSIIIAVLDCKTLPEDPDKFTFIRGQEFAHSFQPMPEIEKDNSDEEFWV